MMRHVYRKHFTSKGEYNKCFHVVSKVLAVHNHFPIECLPDHEKDNVTCYGHFIDPKYGYLLHHKKENILPEKCTHKNARLCSTYDPIIWKYYNQVNFQVRYALRHIFPNG